MLVEDEAFDLGIALEHLGRDLGEPEARHHVGHEAHALAVDLAAKLGAVVLIDQADHGVGMGVVDELVRQERVQQRLDRRIGRHRIEQVGALDAHHVLVGHLVARQELMQRGEPHRRQAGRLDRGHVPARALDAEHVGLVAEKIGHAELDRGVAAAVQHERRIAAEQARRVDAQRQFGETPAAA